MSKKILLILNVVLGSLALVSCGNSSRTSSSSKWESQPEVSILGGDDTTFGSSLDDSKMYDGYFEGGTSNLTITCVSGTSNAFSIMDDVVTFNAISADSVYSISGNLNGSIVINVGDSYKFDLEMHGLSIISTKVNPIMILSGDQVTLTAKKDYSNYIYDERDAIDETDETLYSGAIHSEVDMEVAGKGNLSLISNNNNGIHSKKDLEVKNLTLDIACIDNALKGNDSVSIKGGNLTLIASNGDCIKTTNSDISNKGNQRGIISIVGGNHTLYAACDGIDAAYDVEIDDASTVLNIYTDKYSNYSSEVTDNSETIYYIRNSTKSYKYSIKYYNSDEDYEWVDTTYHSSVSGGRTTYYYYSFAKKSNYSKLKFYIYSSSQTSKQETNYISCSDYISINESYDTIALSSKGFSWTNYQTTTQPGGFGGGAMNEGNTDKGDYSTKGINAANQITINTGNITIKSFDDSIHANNTETLENGSTAKGNVIINDGNLVIYSNDDGIHADGSLSINGGYIAIINSYEGLEGTTITISNGNVSIIAKDDGVNATATTGTGITINDGIIYIYCNGDGIDSNSRTSYTGIVFNGGKTVVISTSSGNSAIDTEAGYKYSGGFVIAIMPNGGMSNEAINCSNFKSVGTTKSISLSINSYLNVDNIVTIKMPTSISGLVIYLGSSGASISSTNSCNNTLDNNGVYWGQ